MTKHQLRPYQQDAVTEIRKYYSKGIKKVLLHLATGGGKTTVFSHILEKTSDRGYRAIMVVRGRKLVDQAHKRLLSQGVNHGVLMANHRYSNPMAPVQVCSIDTLNARKHYPPADLVVYDEAHFCISKSYHDFVRQYPDAFHLAVTATPYVEKSLKHVAEVVVKPITMLELIEQGFLVPPKYYAPMKVDTSGLKVSRSTKDFKTADLEELLEANNFIANLVDSWKEFAMNKRTLAFAVSIAHSKQIVAKFQSAGIKAEHCDADTKEKDRNAIIARLESGETKIVSNVGIFCTGVDVPPLECVMMARPTASKNLFIQQAGRGTRPYEGKEDFILLDCAGNTLRHGYITEEPEADLDGKVPAKTLEVKTCPTCMGVVSQFESVCPFCEFKFADARDGGAGDRSVEESEDLKMGLLEEMPLEAKAYQRHQELKKEQKKKGYKRGWIFYRMQEEFGDEIAQKYCPQRHIPDFIRAQFGQGKGL